MIQQTDYFSFERTTGEGGGATIDSTASDRGYTNWQNIEKFAPIKLPPSPNSLMTSSKSSTPAPFVPPSVPAAPVSRTAGPSTLTLFGEMAGRWLTGSVTGIAHSLIGLGWATDMIGLSGLVAGGFGLVKLLNSFSGAGQPRQRVAATWIYFRIAQEGSKPFLQYLKDQGIKINNVHEVEEYCVFGVAAYHLGQFKRAANKYGMNYQPM